MVRRAKIGGRQIVLVLGPVHPAAYDYATEDYYKDVRRRFELMAEENDTPLIDALDIVPGDLFSDAMHPTDEGAVIMSNFLADKIAELYSAGTLHE
jgi:lysophospholipase L1-like esterase